MTNNEETKDIDLSQENNEEVVEEVVEETEETTEDEPKEDYRGKLNANNRFLEKEGYEFKEGKWVKPETTKEPVKEKKETKDLSTEDTYALFKAEIDMEDIAEVKKYAKMEDISIAEAIKAPIVQGILKDKTEKRTTAEASNVGGSKRVSGKISDETLLANAKKGIMPETDAGIERLFEIRKGINK